MGKYDDIINTKYPFGLGHPRMSIHDRAAQFAPFAALSGYEEAVEETLKVSDEYKEIDEDRFNSINDTLNEIVNTLLQDRKAKIHVEIIYYDNSLNKPVYDRVEGFIRKVEVANRYLVLEDKTKIAFETIYEINIRK